MKKALRGSGGMLPRKIFENLHTVEVILVLFEQILGKFCLNFLPLILSVAPNMMHFVHTFSIMRAEGARLIAIKFEIMEKSYSSKTCLKIPYIPPLDPPLGLHLEFIYSKSIKFFH